MNLGVPEQSKFLFTCQHTFMFVLVAWPAHNFLTASFAIQHTDTFLSVLSKDINFSPNNKY